ncbi:hypothetical protein ALC53_11311, partial [Atta colombica]
ATVITNLISTIPYIGNILVYLTVGIFTNLIGLSWLYILI